MRKLSTAFIVFLIISITNLQAQSFDDLSKNFKDNIDTQKQSHALQLIQAGLTEKRSAESLATLKKWFRENTISDSSLIFQLANAYRQAGQWVEAVRYYQRYLQQDKLNPQWATQATEAVYRLLIVDIRDTAKAYTYMSNNGGKLRNYGSVKKYDHWYLKQAVQKLDAPGMAEYLIAVYKDSKTNHSEYTTYVDSLIDMLSRKLYEKETYAAVNKLAMLPTIAKSKIKLLWQITVVPYSAELDAVGYKEAKIDINKTKRVLEVAKQRIASDPKDGVIAVAHGLFSLHNSRSGLNRMAVHSTDKQKLITDTLLKGTQEQLVRLLDSAMIYGRHAISFSSQTEYMIGPSNARKLLLRFPKLFNKRGAPYISLFDKTLSVKEAQQLAPHLRANPHVDAGVIRAFAVAGPSFPSTIDELMKNEMWRYGRLHEPMRMLWDKGPKRDGDYGKIERKYKKLAEPRNNLLYKALLAQSDKATFEKIFKDIHSATPTIAGARTLLQTILSNAKIGMQDEMISLMISDKAHGIDVLRDQLDRVRLKTKGNKQIRAPYLHTWSHGNDRRHYSTVLPKTIVKMDAIMNKMVSEPGYSIPVAYFSLWFNLRSSYQDAKDIELMKKIMKNPAYPTYGNFVGWIPQRHAFGTAVASTQKKPITKITVDKELTALPRGALPPQVFAAFNTAVERMAKSKKHVMFGINIEMVGSFPKLDEKAKENALRLFSDLEAESFKAPSWQVHAGYEKIALKLIAEMQEKKEWSKILKYTPSFWRLYVANKRSSKLAQTLLDFGEAALEDGNISVAATIPAEGLYTSPVVKEKSRMQGLLSKVLAKMGIAEIEVDKNDPTFHIFKSQTEFLQGNETAAWSLFLNDPEKIAAEGLVRKLNPEYSFWLIKQNLTSGNVSHAKKVGRELYIWSVREKGSLDSTQEGKLKIAMGDIAFKDGNFVNAKSQYNKILSSRVYRGTDENFHASLGVVNVDLATKDFAAALSVLNKLVESREPERRYKALHIRAKVYDEQGNFSDSRKDIKSILEGKANYAINSEAMILKGALDIKQNNFESGQEIEVGSQDSKTTIIPGEPITIKLKDNSLSLSGGSSAIEVEIKAKSGDSETILLRAVGDDKTLFKARIISELGKPKKGDKVLQILGEDEITYDYSDRFRKKMPDLPKGNDIVMVVKSNSSISMSAGAFPDKDSRVKLDLSKIGVSLAQQRLGTRRVRPGNPLYIRVTDYDHSKTSGKDTVKVNIDTTSGDRINNLVLTETMPYSGVFEGSVDTASAITTATASDSEKGIDPNDAITPKKGKAWKGDQYRKKVNGADRYFSVDFNDKVPFGTLKIESDSAGALNKFLVQTSLNGNKWTSRGGYPKTPTAWDGKAEMVLMHPGHWGPTSEGKLPKTWLRAMDIETLSKPYSKLAMKKLGAWKGGSPGHPGAGYLMRFRALFFQPNVASRGFRLTGYEQPKGGNNTFFLIDGVQSDEGLSIFRELQPGVHTIEIWHIEAFSTFKKRNPVLLCDVDGAEELAPCPDNMFDIGSFPPLIQKQINTPVEVTKAGDSNFEIDFGPNLEARAFRLLILGHEGAVPIINNLTMNDRNGKERLPTKSDYRELRTNKTLEVVPGDKVSVLYADDNFIGMDDKNKIDNKGDVLEVAFNNGTIGVSFLKYVNTSAGRKLQLEDIRRFKMGNDIAFIIKDVDQDISHKRDEVKFKVTTSNGFERELTALETDEHSGEFHGRFFPQLEKSTRPAEIQITKGATITAVYRDAENTDPGVPEDRTVTVEHAKYVDPTYTLLTSSTKAFNAPAPVAKSEKEEEESQSKRKEKKPEMFGAKRSLEQITVTQKDAQSTALKTLINSSVHMSIIAPHLALAESSTTDFYIQTESGRQLAEKIAIKNKKPLAKNNGAFNLNIPGTLKITKKVSGGDRFKLPLGYITNSTASNYGKDGKMVRFRKNKKGKKGKKGGGPFGSAINQGLFSLSLPIQLADIPEISFANRSAENLTGFQIPEFLAIRPGDTIYIAYPYFGEADFYDDKKQGRVAKWFTAKYTLDSHIFMDVMDSDFNHSLTQAFVGEKVYIRVVATGLDKTGGRDETRVHIKSASGSDYDFTLRETEGHSGVFKGIFRLSYLVEKPSKNPEEKKEALPAIELHGFPVLYDDKVTISYPGADSEGPAPITFKINNGADGLVKPFSKRFTDSSIAVKTSFTLAECFFELARSHKKQKQESLARRKMKHAEKLLLEALSSHRDEDQQAHAEYLLGNLAQEYASISKNDDSILSSYSDALMRYKKVVTDYPNADFAAKSQYKVAFVYDKMDALEGMQTMEIAIEEYVKLAYKYPEDELIPKVMARIGKYFQGRGKKYKEIAQEKDKKNEQNIKNNKDSEGDGGSEMRQAFTEFLKAANVYNKLANRFPGDPLAPLARLAAAQNFMRCEFYSDSLLTFIDIHENEDLDGEQYRAQAMYWAGICFEKGARDPKPYKGRHLISKQQRAVQLYNRVRYEYSSSKWAKYARGRLVDPGLEKAIEAEELRKERMLEAMEK